MKRTSLSCCYNFPFILIDSSLDNPCNRTLSQLVRRYIYFIDLISHLNRIDIIYLDSLSDP
jgi:hypothetical protein